MADCACGCGERTAGGTYRPGHDQKLRRDLEERVGGLLRLEQLVDSAEAYFSGQLTLEGLGAKVHVLFRTNASRSGV